MNISTGNEPSFLGGYLPGMNLVSWEGIYLEWTWFPGSVSTCNEPGFLGGYLPGIDLVSWEGIYLELARAGYLPGIGPGRVSTWNDPARYP